MVPEVRDVFWCPRPESNQHLILRRNLFYPLNYGNLGRHSTGRRLSHQAETQSHQKPTIY